MAFFQTETLWINQLADGVAALVLDVPDSKVNALGRQALADLDRALDRLEGDGRFQFLILRSGKPDSFCAGADLHELGAVRSPEEAMAISGRGQKLFARLAGLRIPSLAVISGTCLGGGLELALACDYRVVVDRPETRLGLPEIELGLIPGWGGTQRLPRLVGLEPALKIILGGKRLSAPEAVRWGLADELVQDTHDEPPRFLAEPKKKPSRRLPLSTWRQKILESTGIGRRLIFRGARRVLAARLPADMPAPWEALEAVRVGVENGLEAGLACERQAIGKLVSTPACRNLVRLFLLREEARKSGEWRVVSGEKDREQEATPSPLAPRPLPLIRRVGIIGAGTMGAGIAQLAVLKGCEIVVREANEMALGLATLRLMGLFQKAADKGLISLDDLPRLLARVHGTTAWKGFDALDLVVEVIPEDLEQKRNIFRQLEENTSKETILASNTSSLRIQDIQEGLRNPERVAGLHFFNPAHLMPLVEVVRGPVTDPGVVQTLAQWAASLGKIPIMVKDSPGFVVNRILFPYLLEAVGLLEEGILLDRIDQAMRRFGMPMGPLELLDQVGLDVANHIYRGVAGTLGGRFPHQPAFQNMVERGWLGQKSGVGFYRHLRKRKGVNQGAAGLVREGRKNTEHQMGEVVTPSEQGELIRRRLVGLMVNEAAMCLEEGVAADENAIDLAMVLGAGWAPHRGGPFRFAREQGIAVVVASLEELAGRFGPRYQPSPALCRLLTPTP